MVQSFALQHPKPAGLPDFDDHEAPEDENLAGSRTFGRVGVIHTWSSEIFSAALIDKPLLFRNDSHNSLSYRLYDVPSRP